MLKKILICRTLKDRNVYADYLNRQDSMVTVFQVQRDGLIGAFTFIYRKGELQTYYIGIRWKEGGMPEIQGTSVNNVAEIKLTEKGILSMRMNM